MICFIRIIDRALYDRAQEVKDSGKPHMRAYVQNLVTIESEPVLAH